MSQAESIRREQSDHGKSTRIGAFVPHLDFHRLEYGVKLALAVLIALWVELWFNLGMANSVVICVLIVAAGNLGTTIQKSILRMIGNLIGCSIGLVFLAVFAQDRIGGAVAFSLYSVFCCYFLQRSRYAPAWHWTYNSAALVFLFHLGTATSTFTYTTQRWLELSIGIASMTLVSSILWPSRAGTVFERKFLTILRDLAASVGSLRNTMSTTDAPRAPATPERLAAQITALRSTLETASRDTSRYERFHDRYQSLVDELQSLIARATLLADSLSNVNTATDNPGQAANLDLVAAALDHIKTSIDALVEHAQRHFDELPLQTTLPGTSGVHAAVERIRSEVTTTEHGFRDAATTSYVCEVLTSTANEIEHFTEALMRVEEKAESQPRLSAVQSLDSDHVPFWKRLDVRKSLVCGSTIALAFAVWMMTNWPAGPLGIFFAVLVTSKNCTVPYLPPKAMIPGSIVGLFVGAVIYLGVLPTLDGLSQLALVLFPFCAVCGYLTLSSNAKVAGVAGLSAIVAVLVMDLQAHQTFSFGHVVSNSYGLLGGTILAFIVLTVMWPVVPEKMFTRQVKAILRSYRQWLKAVSSDSVANSTSKEAFASQSAKQLGLCRLWGRFINYGRLAPDSERAVTDLIGAIQSTALHLIELQEVRQQRADKPRIESLAEATERMDDKLSKVLDELAEALDNVDPIPDLPSTAGLLADLQGAFDELQQSEADEVARRTKACRVLAAIGQYSALADAIAECQNCLRKLDWTRLNQSYF